MARRKRIPYDPPGNRKRRRRYDGWLRADQIFLSRRLFLAKGLVVSSFAVLAGKLGYMQLVEGTSYKARAKDNVIADQTLPAPRGMILDRQGRTLAENRRSWEVRVVPGNLPANEDERRYVLDTLISALQLEDVLVIDPDAVPSGSADIVYRRVAKMLAYDAKDIDDTVASWKRQGLNGLVKVSNLTIDDAARFRSAKAELPGVNVMNDLDYLVTNIWDTDLEIKVKSDVPRQVAMTLDANSMYLPGVILDDSALVRYYKGGEVMSHIVGYVQGIDSVQLDDIRNKNRQGEPIYSLNDLIGKSGLEVALENDLRGVKGARSIERDNNGVTVRVIPGSETAAVPGKNVKLTIDLELQNAAGKILKEQIDKAATAKKVVNEQRAKDGKPAWAIPNAGTVVALDPRTGEVLAMVSYPYYDNSLFVPGLSSRKWKEYSDPTKGKAFVNRATSELYPPGSTFKSFLAASALHRGALDTKQTHTCAGGIKVPSTYNQADGNPWACWVAWITNGRPHGEMDIYSALEQSCDVFFYNVAPSKSQASDAIEPTYYFDYNLNLGTSGEITNNTHHVFDGEGITHIAEDMKTRFFFGRETGIEINEEIGLFPDEAWKTKVTNGEGWSVGDTLNVSIGQGETQATPLQIAMNVAGLAADGVFQTPRLVHESLDATGKVASNPAKEAGKLGFKQEHIDVVKEGMRRVCNSETGTAFANGDGSSKWRLTNPEGAEKIVVAGKTGTAEFGEVDKIGARDTHGLFTAFAPFEKPEIAVAVVIEAGGEGSTFAVPVADAVIRAYLELTGRRDRGAVLFKDKLPIT